MERDGVGVAEVMLGGQFADGLDEMDFHFRREIAEEFARIKGEIGDRAEQPDPQFFAALRSAAGNLAGGIDAAGYFPKGLPGLKRNVALVIAQAIQGQRKECPAQKFSRGA